MPTDLPTLLHAATGLTWEWSDAELGPGYGSGAYFLCDAGAGCWILRPRDGVCITDWIVPTPGESAGDFNARVATEVAAAFREVTRAR